ncbi:MAG: M23 family metallopeptidase [Thermodesulfobacteriota bacterium]
MFKSMKQLLTLIIIAVLIAFGIMILPKFEWSSPEVQLVNKTGDIGLKPFEIFVKDEGKGLKNVKVYIGDKNNEVLIVDKSYKPDVYKDKILIDLDKKIGIKEGKVNLRIIAEDYSKFKFFKGNITKIDKELNLDLSPPSANELSSVQYLTHGGSGFIIYKSSKDAEKSGIKIGDYFFPGYSGYFKDPSLYICFFAYPYDLDNDEEIYLYAVDKAGNERSIPVFYNPLNASYRESNIDVSEKFITRKMLPLLEEDIPESDSMLKEIFLKVNSTMRVENNKKITEITKKSSDKRLWSGKFQQLSNSKVEANFADKRTYNVNEENVDQQYHLGYDLSVTKKYPVEAANSGIVAFTGNIGIYGNTVIIDHGLGIMTLYSHMSSISVKEGDEVKKGGVIGRTGSTGLAGGDHLHFGIYVNGVPVRPLEWWDPKWINEKIESRIDLAKSEYGE